MGAWVEEVSRITAKGQTTVPKAVRQALGVDPGDQIVFRIDSERVTVRRAEDEGADPAIERFLEFLAHDLQNRPQALSALSPDLMDRLAALTAGEEVDLDGPIEGEVAL